MNELIVILHNIRSTHNVGAILRTLEGFGVDRAIFSGYTPYPLSTEALEENNNPHLPHISEKLDRQIHKTALGAENIVRSQYYRLPPIEQLKLEGYRIVGLEQSEKSIKLEDYKSPSKIALILGEEVAGIPKDILKQCEDILEIPMRGVKESFNVSVAAGVAVYALTR